MHKINCIRPLVFEILNFQQPLWACLDILDPTHVKLHHLFVALIDMYLHSKNQLYTSNSLRHVKV